MSSSNKTSDASKQKSSTASRASTNPSALSLQAKLRMGRPGDSYEREADRVADRVAGNSAPESIQSKEEDEDKSVQASPLAGQISRYVQRRAEEEDEPAQAQAEEEEPVQQQEEEEPVQQQAEEEEPVQQQEEEEPVQQQEEEEPVQQQTDEEEPVQQQEEEESVQQQAEEEEPVQQQAEEEEPPAQAMAEEKDEPVQAKSDKPAESQDPEVESLLAGTKFGGKPLRPEILQEMNNKFGTDFSRVRIHTGTTAADLCQRLGAKAFTHGRHIYFNEGQYDPTSAAGKRLLAHELTHVVQQRGGLMRMVQRATGQGSGGSTTAGNQTTGLVDIGNKTITYQLIKIPAFRTTIPEHKSLYTGWKLRRDKGYSTEPRPDNQRTVWRREVRKARKDLVKKLEAKWGQRPKPSSGSTYVFRGLGYYYMGSLNEIAEAIAIPSWNRKGKQSPFLQVDHIVELQISGYPGNKKGHDAKKNMWLLEKKPNQASGNYIKKKVNQNINATFRNAQARALIEKAIPQLEKERGTKIRQSLVKRNFNLHFNKFKAVGGPAVNDSKYWELKEIKQGKHLNYLEPAALDKDPVKKGHVAVFPRVSGGFRKLFAWNEKKPNKKPKNKGEKNWLSPWIINEKQFYTAPGDEKRAELGQFTIEFPENKISTRIAPYDLTVKRLNQTPTTGAIDPSKYLIQSAGKWALKHLSPILVDTVDYGPGGLQIYGRVAPDIPLLKGTFLEFAIERGEMRVFKSFSTGELSVPKPFSITDSSLTIFASTKRGLGIEGQIDFGIERAGSGFVRGSVSTSGGFGLAGEFNFDSKLFDPAQIRMKYTDKKFSIGGTLGIPAGKVKGIKSATIKVDYAEGKLTAEGDAQLDVPGVESGKMKVVYSDKGFMIAGTFNLSKDIPGIRSGSISASIKKVTGEEGYQLKAKGTAVPDIPGIESQLTVEYDNGAITVHGKASYKRGILSGKVEVGATNRALDADGKPTGKPTDRFLMYGGGEVTVRVTPWLQGTVGVKFQPNGEIIVSGKIGLPSSVEVFRRFGIPEKEVFSLGFDIPIFAIPLGTRSIGLVASIRGGLRVYAGIGPGKLEKLELGITYNPARPEDTHITGAGRFVVPAEAGLRLFIRATIGLSAGIGGVEGGLELGAGIGLQAAAEAGVNVDWTPKKGLELRATLGAYVQPKLIFTIDGLIRAWFLWWEKIWRWRLADYEFGPDLRFGVQLPIVYKQGQPFNISFDDIKFQKPKISAKSLLGGLIRDIRKRRS